jgi:hypothetical protein
MTAKFQADLVIAYRTVNLLNDLAICSDSNQAAQTGHECICIKLFTLKEKNHKTELENIGIFCSSKSSLKKICDMINLPLDSPDIKIPKYPLFDYTDMDVRCLITVGIGCDVHLKGVSGVTPKRVYDVINK